MEVRFAGRINFLAVKSPKIVDLSQPVLPPAVAFSACLSGRQNLEVAYRCMEGQ